LSPRLGKIKLQKVTVEQVQRWQTQFLDSGTGPRTVQLAHINLGQALDVAIKLGKVPRNVIDLVDQPRYRAREMQCWTADEAQRFIAVADQSIHGPVWLLALVTGLRKGELLGLRWQDIDGEAKTLRVVQTVGALHGKVEFKGTKRPKSRRIIDLDDRSWPSCVPTSCARTSPAFRPERVGRTMIWCSPAASAPQ
jgi:integrase